MTGHDWDGSERRQALLLAEELAPKRPTAEVPILIVVAGFAIVALFQLANLWGLVILNNHQQAEQGHAEEFRQHLTCFVVKATQGKQGPDVLTDCGFLQTGATK